MTAERFAELLEARRTQSGWMARCPAHGGRKRKLAIRVGREGQVLLKCFTRRCPPEDIVDAMGLEMVDLFPEGHRRGRPMAWVFADERLRRELSPLEYETLQREAREHRRREDRAARRIEETARVISLGSRSDDERAEGRRLRAKQETRPDATKHMSPEQRTELAAWIEELYRDR